METAGKQRRMTRQRRVILDELRKLRCHPSAEELHGIVRRAMPGISLGTVYRNLDVLWEDGKILKLEALGAQALVLLLAVGGIALAGMRVVRAPDTVPAAAE